MTAIYFSGILLDMKRKKLKTGPKPFPLAKLKRHCVLVKLNDDEYSRVRHLASGTPLATFVRNAVLGPPADAQAS